METTTLVNCTRCGSANTITRQIITWLNASGHYAFRVNNIPATKQRRNTIHKGIPDIMGITKSGDALAIEVKTTDKQSEEQKKFQQRWEDRNGIYIVAHNLEDVINSWALSYN